MKPAKFLDILQANRINCYAGVPDSLLKEFCKEIATSSNCKNLITANEGSAIAYAAGHFLATGELACVYMQNSGQGNAINPLVSLADADVYSIPMVLLIGWRGQPGVKDEPQHKKQGEISLELQKTIGVKTIILSQDSTENEIIDTINYARKNLAPVAFLVTKNYFDKSDSKLETENDFEIIREYAIEKIASVFSQAAIISTTGKISRELYEIRNKFNQSHESDFLTVGSMGHCSMIALGVAEAEPAKQVLALDGDGAAIMHLGSLAIVGQSNASNLKHIVLNNAAHESVGAQPTVANKIDLSEIAKNTGYAVVPKVKNACDLLKRLTELSEQKGPAFLEICVAIKTRSDLGRPKEAPVENKMKFMNFIKKCIS